MTGTVEHVSLNLTLTLALHQADANDETCLSENNVKYIAINAPEYEPFIR